MHAHVADALAIGTQLCPLSNLSVPGLRALFFNTVIEAKDQLVRNDSITLNAQHVTLHGSPVFE